MLRVVSKGIESGKVKVRIIHSLLEIMPRPMFGDNIVIIKYYKKDDTCKYDYKYFFCDITTMSITTKEKKS